MKISTILDHIDSGHMALPEFQRGYVWNRDQVRGLFDLHDRRRPVGALAGAMAASGSHRGYVLIAAAYGNWAADLRVLVSQVRAI